MPFKGLVEQFFTSGRLESRIGDLAERGYVLPPAVCPHCGFGAMRAERPMADRETFQLPVDRAWLRCDRVGCGYRAAASQLEVATQLEAASMTYSTY